MKKDEISLVIVDAHSHSIEELADIAVAEIGALAKSGIAGKVFQYAEGSGDQVYGGKFTERQYGTTLDITDALKEAVPGEVILVGGSLGNQHYHAFTRLLGQMSKSGKPSVLHLPFNATYTFTQEYDSGEGWTAGKIATRQDQVFDNYVKAVSRYGGNVALLESGVVSVNNPLVTVKLHEKWQDIKAR